MIIREITRLCFIFKKAICGLFIVAIVNGLLINALPVTLKLLINDINNANVTTIFLQHALIYSLLYLLSILNKSCYDLIWMKLRPNMQLRIADALMQKILYNCHLLLQSYSIGNLASKLTDIENGIPIIIRAIIEQIFASLVAIVISSVVLYQISPFFSIAFVLWAAIFLAVSYALSSKIIKKAQNVARARAYKNELKIDTLNNALSVYFFDGIAKEIEILQNRYKRYILSIESRDILLIKISIFQGLSFVIYLGSCFAMILFSKVNDFCTEGDIALLLSLNISLLQVLSRLSNNIIDFIEEYGATKEGLRLVGDIGKKSLSQINLGKNATITNADISFQDVCFSYDHKKQILDKISFDIKQGQWVAFVGPSGSGKTTLINLLMKLVKPCKGLITIGGKNIEDIDIVGKVGIIHQNSKLFNRAIIDNITYPNDNIAHSEIYNVAKLTLSHEFIIAKENQYQTKVIENGFNLSGGQKQRIAISRALMQKFNITIFDEATSQIDSETEDKILKNLKSKFKNQTILMISHKDNFLKYADRVFYFANGTITEKP
jgi:ABC-type multidrug transport system fused ATPase/permease subunit